MMSNYLTLFKWKNKKNNIVNKSKTKLTLDQEQRRMAGAEVGYSR